MRVLLVPLAAVLVVACSKDPYAMAEACNPKEFTTCSKPLSLLTGSSFSLVSNKTVLDKICPELNNSISCLTAFSRRCMDRDSRRHFWNSFNNTRSMVDELCRNGAFQDEYLLQVPCMSKVEEENAICLRNYNREIQEITSRIKEISDFNGTKMGAGIIGNVCCAFQSYVECSTETIRRICGEASAAFNRKFLYKMSSSMLQSHCLKHGSQECGLLTSTSTAAYNRRRYVTFMLILTIALK